MINLPQITGLASMVFMFWSGGQLALTDLQAHRTGVPALLDDEKPVAQMRVDIEEIQSFDQYYINEVNPFVPFNQREPERKRMWTRRNRPRDAKPPVTIPEEKKPVETPTLPVKLPELVLPTIKPTDAVAPKIIGNVSMGDRFLVFVELGDKEAQMQAGDKIGGWTLLRMEDTQVFFQDPDGQTVSVSTIIGNTNTISQSTAQGTGSSGAGGIPQMPQGMDAKQLIDMLGDPGAVEMIENMAKDPKNKKLLMNPTVQRMLREAGLDHLLN